LSFGKKLLAFTAFILVLGFLVPEPRVIPVHGAKSSDWNAQTFWYEPWGRSGVHKGIDIFASHNTPVIAASHQIVLYRGTAKNGGNIILALGPKWTLHYYAHLSQIDDGAGLFVSKGTKLGSVGDTGNAAGKSPHLHYSLVSLLPRVWRIDTSSQGYKKAFYLNPIEYLSQAESEE
jgi:murein DD-endopeptidase MepM/ murein hydrolase activator NlpD